MIYKTTHVTNYKYEEPVSQCLSETRLAPRTFPGQRAHESTLDIFPEPAVFETRNDYFGNQVASFSVFSKHDHFSITASSIVEVDSPERDRSPGPAWEEAQAHLALKPDAESLQASEFLYDSPFVEASGGLEEFARPSFPPGRPLKEAVENLSHRVHSEFRYEPKSTSIDIPLVEVLQLRRGVCQDFAHVMIGALRSWRLAARYVSGYLRSGTKYQGAEASHAWVSVYIPGSGWLDLDPTNDVIPSGGHITVAWGRDYGDVTPVKGISLGGGGHIVEVEVSMRPAPDYVPESDF